MGERNGHARRGSRLLAGLAVAVALALGLSFLGSWSSALDLLAHFRVQLTALAALLAVGLAATRRAWIAAAILGATALLGAATVVPLYVAPAGQPDGARTGATFFAHNTWGRSGEVDGVLAQIEDSGADLVFLQELSRTLRPEVERLADSYRVVIHRDNAVLVSKRPGAPLEVAAIEPWSEDSWLGFEIAAKLDGQPLAVLAVHLSSPRTLRGLRRRDRQLAALREWSETRELPHVVIGDLNTTPWSHGLRSVLRGTTLVDSSRGFGVQATYPCFGPAGLTWPIRIPIDHALHTPELATLGRELGDAAGSNHRPLKVVLGWRDAPATAP